MKNYSKDWPGLLEKALGLRVQISTLFREASLKTAVLWPV